MTRYRRLRAIAVVILLVEFVVGLGGTLTPRTEIFPFASWFLFSLVPGKVNDYDLVLRAAGDRPLDPAPRFSQAGRLVHAPHSIVVYQLIQQFGRAVEKNDPRTDLLRRQVEVQFLVPAVRYDLVKATYRPVARYEHDQTLSITPLRSYVAGQF